MWTCIHPYIHAFNTYQNVWKTHIYSVVYYIHVHVSYASIYPYLSIKHSDGLVSCMVCWPCCPMAVDGRRAASLGARQRLRPTLGPSLKGYDCVENMGYLGILIKLQVEWENGEKPLYGGARIRNCSCRRVQFDNLPITLEVVRIAQSSPIISDASAMDC